MACALEAVHPGGKHGFGNDGRVGHFPKERCAEELAAKMMKSRGDLTMPAQEYLAHKKRPPRRTLQ